MAGGRTAGGVGIWYADGLDDGDGCNGLRGGRGSLKRGGSGNGDQRNGFRDVSDNSGIL